MDKTVIILAWHSSKESRGKVKDELTALIKGKLGLCCVYSWSGSSRDKEPYPEIPKDSERVFILPIFMCHGFMLRAALPGLVESIHTQADSKVICLPPVGLHDALADMITTRVTQTADINNISPKDAHLVIVAHGSQKHPESAQSARDLIKHIRSKELFAGVHESYLEQPPYPGSIVASLSGPVIAEALFLTTGRHFSNDFPAAIARGQRPVLFTPQDGLSRDPMFNEIVCEILDHALTA